MADGLELADILAVRRLKKLRRRSMKTAGWRDSEYVAKHLRRRYLRWAEDTPLEAFRAAALAAAEAHGRVTQGANNAVAERLWFEVQGDVDKLLRRADEVAGHHIRGDR
jgi:hypothetical protein